MIRKCLSCHANCLHMRVVIVEECGKRYWGWRCYNCGQIAPSDAYYHIEVVTAQCPETGKED